MAHLSFHEKSAWGTLIALMAIGGLYAHSAWNLWQVGPEVGTALFGLGVGYTVLLVIVLVAYHILIALLARPEPEDERDRLIGWRAGSIAGLVLGFGVFTIILHIVLTGWQGDPLALSPAFIANALLLAIFLSSCTELGLKLYYYRRGI